MEDVFVSLKWGEVVNVYATLDTHSTTTQQIASATVTLQTIPTLSPAVVVGNLNQVACQVTSGPATLVQAWYLFNPQSLGVAPGTYDLVFSITLTSGVVRKVIERIEIQPG